jgi:multidrug resistance efflux pump
MSVQEATPPVAPPVNGAATGAAGAADAGTAAAAAPGASGAGAKPRRNVRRVLVPLVAVAVVAGALFGFNAWWNGTHYVSTENAQIMGQPIQVGSMNAGRIASVDATVGAQVHRGDVLAQVALPSVVGTGQSGAPKLDFLGAADTRVDVQAPIDGVVIAVSGAIGSTVAQGQPIVTLVDPAQLYVNANIDETKVGRVHAGQVVEVHVDTLDRTVEGRVEAVTPATAATFSLLPSANTTGNFTKVTQVVPTRIAVNFGNAPGLLGSSVSVKIRVA